MQSRPHQAAVVTIRDVFIANWSYPIRIRVKNYAYNSDGNVFIFIALISKFELMNFYSLIIPDLVKATISDFHFYL